ncbi:DASH family cryptochrome [Pedobacter sp.]|uniref:DASH family cryptochrome n=1 Tax=Pedobacter sp. TaxID=1411316 RepID=UPI00396C723A
MGKRILVWFRNDLRLHDNEMLTEAIAKSDEILPVYFFDPRHFEKTAYFTHKTGLIRTRFLVESVNSLRDSFTKLNGNILVLRGKPEELLPELALKYDITEVYHHREVASEETLLSSKVEDLLWKQKLNLKHFIGHTLYNKKDLPFPVKDIPDVFTQFKKKTERDAVVKPCFLTPQNIQFVEVADWGQIPEAEELLPLADFSLFTNSIPLKGGEQEGLTHLYNYLHTSENLELTAALAKKADVISALSPWLSLGCLSPREVYWKIKEAERIHGPKPFYNQIVLGLLWRDYYRFMFKKYGNAFFRTGGFGKEEVVIAPVQVNDSIALQNWKEGKTDQPLVNEYMLELKNTGFISHQGRQLVATYLIHELKVLWILGAWYFEETLIDYCPASNWGNWASIAGVGNDAKLNGNFDFEKQLKNLAPKRTFSLLADS